jgi:4-amino-4-deoxy-L-arabinose transferase-like glycosyltransferase
MPVLRLISDKLRRWPIELIPIVIFLAWLYRQSMPPGVSSWIVTGWDSAVLQITGSSWGIPHSPGYPFYTILANLFVRLLGLLPYTAQTSVAWRVTLCSTVTSLLTVILLYLIIWHMTKNRVAAVVAGMLLGVSFIFWRAAIMAEVYSLNALLFALTYYLALIWADDQRDRWLCALGLALGAAMAHHRTAFVLPPTVALWVWAGHWQTTTRRWGILGVVAVGVLLLSYLYLPWAAHNRAGQTWLYADTSDWNTFWFVALTREWWGLVKPPATGSDWLNNLEALLWQQAGQITVAGLLAGLAGLLVLRSYWRLFGLPLLMLILFGLTYQVADLDSMLIPLTLTLTIGLGSLAGLVIRSTATRVGYLFRIPDISRKRLCATLKVVLSLGLAGGAYLVLRPLAETNYRAVDLSEDWQAEDLIEEVIAIAKAGAPLTIIGQDNSVLPDFIYAQIVLGQPVEPLSTTRLSRMPEKQSIALLRERLQQQRRLLVDIETIELGFIPWLSQAIATGQIFLAPTGHPYLWELLPRPMSNSLPPNEPLTTIDTGQFLDGKLSIIAFHQRILHKRTGCFLRLTLFWRAEKYLEEDYFVAVQPLGGETVLDKNDHLALMRGHLPTSQIRPGEVIRDEVDLLIRQPAALPTTNLVINLYQVQGELFPAFGEVTLPITTSPDGCRERIRTY